MYFFHFLEVSVGVGRGRRGSPGRPLQVLAPSRGLLAAESFVWRDLSLLHSLFTWVVSLSNLLILLFFIVLPLLLLLSLFLFTCSSSASQVPTHPSCPCSRHHYLYPHPRILHVFSFPSFSLPSQPPKSPLLLPPVPSPSPLTPSCSTST